MPNNINPVYCVYDESQELEEYHIHRDKFLISIVVGYIRSLSGTCNFPKLAYTLLFHGRSPSRYFKPDPCPLDSFKQELKQLLVVPTLKTFYQTRNRVNKFHLVESFLSLLLQLLYHRPGSNAGPSNDRIKNLEKELRFLLTILGDISWTLCNSHEHDARFQNLLSEFEALANQAGSFVYYLFFSMDRTFEETDEGLASILKRTYTLKVNLQSHIRIPACTTPTTSMVDSILILSSLVDDVDDLLRREDDPIADVKDQVKLLHHELLLSNSSIKDMTSPQPSEVEELKRPLMCIGDYAHQAEYLITSFLVKDAPLWYVFKRLSDLTRRVQRKRRKLQLITQKYVFGGLNVAKDLNAEMPIHDKRNTKGNDVNVGFEDITRDILDQLVAGGTQCLQVISILGMPGLGKTTLANKLYNHPLVNYTFDKLSWSVVSQRYKKQSILANILIHINSELDKDKILNMKEISLTEHIHKTLMGRRYLIVLDDVWDTNVSNELLRCFPENGNGSRILLTSRNKDVAPPKSIIHELPFLSDEQCWELLEKKVFGSRICPPELQGTGMRIAAKCCGLPLTVVVIAGVLSTVDEKESTWIQVGRNLVQYVDWEDNSVMQILELSYKHLPNHLKPCFLYFGEFEEDKKISVGKLKRLWVAEGFIHKVKGKSAENIAAEYLMELIDKSLVMIAERRKDGSGAKSCVVHDFLRDLCFKLSKEERFLNKPKVGYHNINEKSLRVRARGYSEPLIYGYGQRVRSFVGDCHTPAFYFRDMRLLRILYFKRFMNHSFIYGLEYLVNLRFLVIYSLPAWIDTLVNLEYVRVEKKWTYVPPTIEKMKKLRYLHAKSAEYGKDWNTSYQTNNLEYLSELAIIKVNDEEFLKSSPNLHKLKCKYYASRRMAHFDLRFLTQLDSLSLSGRLSKGDFGFPSNIRKLTLSHSGFPWEKMSIVGRLEFLEVLKLSLDAFVGETWDTKDGEFQKLKFLQLEIIKFSEWNVTSNEHFPKLQRLILIGCYNLGEIPGEIGEFTALKLIEVKGSCRKSVVESAERIKEEQQDMGNEELKVIIGKDAGHRPATGKIPNLITCTPLPHAIDGLSESLS